MNTVCSEEPGEYRAHPPTGPRTLPTMGRAAPHLPGRPALLPSRETSGVPVPQPSPAPPRTPLEVSLRLADALALSIRTALERVAIPLARALAAFTARRCWEEFGFARLEDHARERFARSGRWVNDCAALGHALESLPLLAAALTGDDGGRPIGRVAATLVGRIATPESAGAWVALARAVPVRLLREAVRAARAAGSTWPPRAADSTGPPRADDSTGPLRADDSAGALAVDGAARAEGALDPTADDLSDRSLVRILVPAPVLAAFDEAVDLHRCEIGRAHV